MQTNLSATFDRAGLFKRIDRKDKRVLGRTGAYGRQVMRRGQRRKKGASSDGGYPNAHAGQLRDLVFFNVDLAAGSVSIGPLKFEGAEKNLPAGVETIPQLINQGGTVRKEVGREGSKRIEALVYKPRPFVELSTQTTADRLADLYEKTPL